MDISNVFVIMGTNWNKKLVIEDIRVEGYKHNFYFSNDRLSNKDDELKKMAIADEIWCFGDCSANLMYHYAIKNNKDIWRMG